MWYSARMSKINIRHGKLLEPFFNFYVKNSPTVRGWVKWVSPTENHIEEKIRLYKEIWSKYEKNVLDGIYSCLGLPLNENTNVYIVAGINRDMSDPVIISAHKGPKNFLISLTHELIHRTLSSNKNLFVINNDSLLIQGDDKTVNSHILVFSALRKIFEKDQELLEVIANSAKEGSYKKAYEISGDYENILEFFRNKLGPL